MKNNAAFDLFARDEKERDRVAAWLCDELDLAQAARHRTVGQDADLDYWHTLYEQGRTRTEQAGPWPDAADLTSYLGTQYVDAMTARATRVIFTEPICTVEGWGASADRAPVVEEFHQWKAEEERLQEYCAKAFRLSFIEGMGVLEISEGAQRRKQKVQGRYKVVTEPDPVTGEPVPVFDLDGKPQLAMNEENEPIPADNDAEPFAEAILTKFERVRTGPQYRIVPSKTFAILPGHAKDRADIWGYVKTFWKRVPELIERAKQGVYDAGAVTDIGEESERETTADEVRQGVTVAPQEGPTAEKHLGEFSFLRDLDEDGIEEWYLATVSLMKRKLLRLKLDDLGLPRFLIFRPLPREDSVDGYSLIGHKLLTLIEEHTALRNKRADRLDMSLNPPLQLRDGAVWDPASEPWGSRAVIPVAQLDGDVRPFQMPDEPASAREMESQLISAAQRIVGLNDIASGMQPQFDRTLGEIRMMAAYSEVRIEEMISNLRETIEDLYQIRHAIWKRLLREQEKGLELPKSQQVGLENRGVEIPEGLVTSDTLEGTFRFKPRGSTETSDLLTQRQDFNQFLVAIGAMGKFFPSVIQRINQPRAVDAILEQAVRVHRVPDRQAFLAPAPMMPSALPGQPPGMPMAPGMPAAPGLPPLAAPSAPGQEPAGLSIPGLPM